LCLCWQQAQLKLKEEVEANLAKAIELAGEVPDQLAPLQEKFNEKKAEIENLALRSEQTAAKLASVHKNIIAVRASRSWCSLLLPSARTYAPDLLLLMLQSPFFRSRPRRSKFCMPRRS
jgi:hypothetical protein